MTAPWNTIYCVQSSPPYIWRRTRAQTKRKTLLHPLRGMLPVRTVHLPASAPAPEIPPSAASAFSLDRAISPSPPTDPPPAYAVQGSAPPSSEFVDSNQVTQAPPCIPEATTEQDAAPSADELPDLPPGEACENRPEDRWLLPFKNLWFLRFVSVSVRGTLLSGIPIFVRDEAIRMVNDDYSYLIPLHSIDYIRTPDGLKAAEENFAIDGFTLLERMADVGLDA